MFEKCKYSNRVINQHMIQFIMILKRYLPKKKKIIVRVKINSAVKYLISICIAIKYLEQEYIIKNK